MKINWGKLWEQKKLKNWLGLIVIAGLIVTIYWPVNNFELSHFDDQILLEERLEKLKSPNAWKQAFSEDAFSFLSGEALFYRPILTWTFIIDAKWDNPVKAAHISNIIYHIIACWVVFWFLSLWKISYGQRLTASIFMGIHPSLAQAVAWLPGRNDSLASIAIILSVGFFIKWFKDNKSSNWWGHLGFLIVGIFIKESAFLVIGLAAILYFAKRIKSKKVNKDDVVNLVLSWLSILIFWLILKSSAFAGKTVETTLMTRLSAAWQNLIGLITYMGKLLIPINLSPTPTLSETSLWPGIIVLLGLAGTTFLIKKQRKMFFWGAIWIMIFLLPAIIPGDIKQQQHVFLEHRLYTSMLGMLMMAVAIWQNIKDKYRKLGMVGIGLLFIFFVKINTDRLNVFANGMSFWKESVRTADSLAFGHGNLAVMYRQQGLLQQSEKESKKAIELFPQIAYAHQNLAAIYLEEDRLDEAEQMALAEIELGGYDNAYFTLGMIYEKQGKIEKAVEAWQKSLDTNPDYWQGNSTLAQYYYFTKDRDIGEAYYKKAKASGVTFLNKIENFYKENMH
jgi:protein O-mannosyl-transferase